ncbi:tautomerase family protein [Rhodococcus sp. NPDC057529]|uniref:tautomerase family protein n=1 Tax=Rhodococcus sp. NPDC057529 TaxID=3346158 RepID=UPI00366CCE21
MPTVKVHLRKGRTPEQKDAIATSIQKALVENLGIPDEDRYQLFQEYDDTDFRHTDGYLGLEYSRELLIIEITFIEGRGDEVKRGILRDINANLVSTAGLRADDALINIIEVARTNISFGQGRAQRAEFK